ncbi:MAG: hypothetical protein J0G32_07975 [Alphaproteobacteria bacterium]|nr:hypothetical protein [Alphaproteobacteria bacterium]OJV15841.1 MAG: hypothetical protein BGO27_08010 [Alphaproteobacteria bacterium 33-17]
MNYLNSADKVASTAEAITILADTQVRLSAIESYVNNDRPDTATNEISGLRKDLAKAIKILIDNNFPEESKAYKLDIIGANDYLSVAYSLRDFQEISPEYKKLSMQLSMHICKNLTTNTITLLKELATSIVKTPSSKNAIKYHTNLTRIKKINVEISTNIIALITELAKAESIAKR